MAAVAYLGFWILQRSSAEGARVEVPCPPPAGLEEGSGRLGLSPLHRKFVNFLNENGVFWCRGALFLKLKCLQEKASELIFRISEIVSKSSQFLGLRSL